MKSAFNHQSKKTQEELAKELLGAFLFGGSISDELKDELTKDETKDTEENFEPMAQYMKNMYDSLIKVGFSEDQAFVLLNTFIEGAAAGFKR